MPSSKPGTSGSREYCKTSGKIRYENQALAFSVHRSAHKTSPKRRTKKAHPYHCRACGGWHVGNTLPQVSSDTNTTAALRQKRKRREKLARQRAKTQDRQEAKRTKTDQVSTGEPELPQVLDADRPG